MSFLDNFSSSYMTIGLLCNFELSRVIWVTVSLDSHAVEGMVLSETPFISLIYESLMVFSTLHDAMK